MYFLAAVYNDLFTILPKSIDGFAPYGPGGYGVLHD